MTIILVTMARRLPYEIVYDPQVGQHLRAIERKYHSLIRRSNEEQLRFEPQSETRNRKPLSRQAELDADWELRFGPNNRFRVFYGIDDDRREVNVLAIGVKRGNQLLIAGEEIEL